ncbi:MAG: hypothetical protein ACR2NM_14740 [Bythopirellula sp.]
MTTSAAIPLVTVVLLIVDSSVLIAVGVVANRLPCRSLPALFRTRFV